MAEALRVVALRLLPVRPNLSTGQFSDHPRGASLLWRRHHNTDRRTSDISTIFSQAASLPCVAIVPSSGLARLARAVLTYVVVGISAVTVNQLTGNSVLYAKDMESVKRSNYTMMAAAEEEGEYWRHKEYSLKEDLKRAKDGSPTLFNNVLPISEDSSGKPKELWAVNGKYSSGGDSCHKSGGLLRERDCPKATAEEIVLVGMFERGFHDALDEYSEDPLEIEKPTLASNALNESTTPSLSLLLNKKEIDDASKAEELNLLGYGPKEKSLWQTTSDGKYSSDGDSCHKSGGLLWELNCSKAIKEEIALMGMFERGFHDALDECSEDPLEIEEPNLVLDGSNANTTILSLQLNKKEINDASKVEEANVSGSSSNERSLWRTAGEEQLAELVSKSTFVENCDLPLMSPLASCDLSFSPIGHLESMESLDKALLGSLIRGEEPSFLENEPLHLPNLLLLGNLKSSFNWNSEPPSWAIPVSPAMSFPTLTSSRQKSRFSFDDPNSKWKGGSSGGSVCRSTQDLGKALCCSQTRAREAEMAVTLVRRENKRISKLLFQEALWARAYRQWSRLLEMENALCGMHFQDLLADYTYQNPFEKPPKIFMRPDNPIGHCLSQSVFRGKVRSEEEWASCGRSNLFIEYTLGLAFSLGLSLAGVSLLIGWSMGLIVTTC